MTVPAPPDPFDPVVEVVAAGTRLYRVHEAAFPSGEANDGTVFNPGFGQPTRFAFFGDPPVPVLYAASTPEAAVYESILHGAEPGMFIPRAWWRSKVLSALEVRTDLRVAALHSAGLRRFGLYPADLTDTDMRSYTQTAAWAEAAYQAGLDGVSYMCRHHNSSMAVCLFDTGRRNAPVAALPHDPGVRFFRLPADTEYLAQLAWDIRVLLRP